MGPWERVVTALEWGVIVDTDAPFDGWIVVAIDRVDDLAAACLYSWEASRGVGALEISLARQVDGHSVENEWLSGHHGSPVGPIGWCRAKDRLSGAL
jgi:hypothetical protein